MIPPLCLLMCHVFPSLMYLLQYFNALQLGDGEASNLSAYDCGRRLMPGRSFFLWNCTSPTIHLASADR